MQNIIEKYFPRRVESLDDLFLFLDEVLHANEVAEAILFNVKLCIEELFVNMVRYQPNSREPVLVRLELDQEKLIITLIDRDVDFFDVSRPRDVNTQAPLEERRPGGLGIFLVHRLMDDVTYTYENQISTIRLIKKK